MSQIDLVGRASVATPATGEATIYVDSVSKTLKSKNDAGTVTDYSAAGNSITSLTGEVTASGPGAAAATVTNAAVIGKVLTGLTATAGTIAATDTILQAFAKLVNKQNSSVYPSNTPDGTVTISSNTTMVRDMYFDNLTIDLGATLFTAGFRIFVRNNLIINGIIDRSGNDATGTAATAALVAGTLAAGGAGGAGGTAAGAAGGGVTPALGGAGATGGATASAGGTAGTVAVPAANLGGIEVLNDPDRARLTQTTTNVSILGGAGGGGGAGDGVAGGAGGSGGGVIVLIARSITGTGTVIARGGNGFQPIAGNRGGGGGAGGGVIATISETDPTASSIVWNVSGGIGASGSGTGGSGGNGSNGRRYHLLA
jgi:hypothetical protein